MKNPELEQVLAALVAVLARHQGHDDEAIWLDARLTALRTTDDEARYTQIRQELRRIIPGMGGLIDINLPAPDGEALRDLTERLYDLTK